MRKLLIVALMLSAVRLSAATYTFTESNSTGIAQAATCGGVTTASQTFVLVQSGAATGTIASGSIAAGASISYTFTTAASDPGVTSWAAGNWVTGVNVSTGGSGVQWTTTCVLQLNSGGTLVNTVGSLTGQTTDLGSTGLKTHTVSGSAETPTATDRIQVVTVFKNTNAHGNASFSCTIGTTASGETVATPIVVPASASQVIMITSLFDWLKFGY